MIRRRGVLAAQNLLRAILVFLLLQPNGLQRRFANQTACQTAIYDPPCISIYRTFKIVTTISNEQQIVIGMRMFLLQCFCRNLSARRHLAPEAVNISASFVSESDEKAQGQGI